jgi:hypothetical protein
MIDEKIDEQAKRDMIDQINKNFLGARCAPIIEVPLEAKYVRVSFAATPYGWLPVAEIPINSIEAFRIFRQPIMVKIEGTLRSLGEPLSDIANREGITDNADEKP